MLNQGAGAKCINQYTYRALLLPQMNSSMLSSNLQILYLLSQFHSLFFLNKTFKNFCKYIYIFERFPIGYFSCLSLIVSFLPLLSPFFFLSSVSLILWHLILFKKHFTVARTLNMRSTLNKFLSIQGSNPDFRYNLNRNSVELIHLD